MQQAREVAVAGLHPVEGVRVLPWQLALARRDMGCSGPQCGMWQLPHWDMCAVWGFLLQPQFSPVPCGSSLVAEGCGVTPGD